MQACHTAAAVSAVFDEPNLVSCAGLVPVLRLAERAGLPAAAQQRVRLPASAGSGAANPGAKITSIVAGMVAGADSIDDLGVIPGLRQSHVIMAGCCGDTPGLAFSRPG